MAEYPTDDQQQLVRLISRIPSLHPPKPTHPPTQPLPCTQLEELAAETSDKPRILLMGPRRCGKTSIERVVFDKMSPHETLFLVRCVRA